MRNNEQDFGYLSLPICNEDYYPCIKKYICFGGSSFFGGSLGSGSGTGGGAAAPSPGPPPAPWSQAWPAYAAGFYGAGGTSAQLGAALAGQQPSGTLGGLEGIMSPGRGQGTYTPLGISLQPAGGVYTYGTEANIFATPQLSEGVKLGGEVSKGHIPTRIEKVEYPQWKPQVDLYKGWSEERMSQIVGSTIHVDYDAAGNRIVSGGALGVPTGISGPEFTYGGTLATPYTPGGTTLGNYLWGIATNNGKETPGKETVEYLINKSFVDASHEKNAGAKLILEPSAKNVVEAMEANIATYKLTAPMTSGQLEESLRQVEINLDLNKGDNGNRPTKPGDVLISWGYKQNGEALNRASDQAPFGKNPVVSLEDFKPTMTPEAFKIAEVLVDNENARLVQEFTKDTPSIELSDAKLSELATQATKNVMYVQVPQAVNLVTGFAHGNEMAMKLGLGTSQVFKGNVDTQSVAAGFTELVNAGGADQAYTFLDTEAPIARIVEWGTLTNNKVMGYGEFTDRQATGAGIHDVYVNPVVVRAKEGQKVVNLAKIGGDEKGNIKLSEKVTIPASELDFIVKNYTNKEGIVNNGGVYVAWQRYLEAVGSGKSPDWNYILVGVQQPVVTEIPPSPSVTMPIFDKTNTRFDLDTGKAFDIKTGKQTGVWDAQASKIIPLFATQVVTGKKAEGDWGLVPPTAKLPTTTEFTKENTRFELETGKAFDKKTGIQTGVWDVKTSKIIPIALPVTPPAAGKPIPVGPLVGQKTWWGNEEREAGKYYTKDDIGLVVEKTGDGTWYKWKSGKNNIEALYAGNIYEYDKQPDKLIINGEWVGSDKWEAVVTRTKGTDDDVRFWVEKRVISEVLDGKPYPYIPSVADLRNGLEIHWFRAADFLVPQKDMRTDAQRAEDMRTKSQTLGKNKTPLFDEKTPLNGVVNPALAQFEASINSGRYVITTITAKGCPNCPAAIEELDSSVVAVPYTDFYILTTSDWVHPDSPELQRYYDSAGGFPSVRVWKDGVMLTNAVGNPIRYTAQDAVREVAKFVPPAATTTPPPSPTPPTPSVTPPSPITRIPVVGLVEGSIGYGDKSINIHNVNVSVVGGKTVVEWETDKLANGILTGCYGNQCFSFEDPKYGLGHKVVIDTSNIPDDFDFTSLKSRTGDILSSPELSWNPSINNIALSAKVIQGGKPITITPTSPAPPTPPVIPSPDVQPPVTSTFTKENTEFNLETGKAFDKKTGVQVGVWDVKTARIIPVTPPVTPTPKGTSHYGKTAKEYVEDMATLAKLPSTDIHWKLAFNNLYNFYTDPKTGKPDYTKTYDAIVKLGIPAIPPAFFVPTPVQAIVKPPEPPLTIPQATKKWKPIVTDTLTKIASGDTSPRVVAFYDVVKKHIGDTGEINYYGIEQDNTRKALVAKRETYVAPNIPVQPEISRGAFYRGVPEPNPLEQQVAAMGVALNEARRKQIIEDKTPKDVVIPAADRMNDYDRLILRRAESHKDTNPSLEDIRLRGGINLYGLGEDLKALMRDTAKYLKPSPMETIPSSLVKSPDTVGIIVGVTKPVADAALLKVANWEKDKKNNPVPTDAEIYYAKLAKQFTPNTGEINYYSVFEKARDEGKFPISLEVADVLAASTEDLSKYPRLLPSQRAQYQPTLPSALDLILGKTLTAPSLAEEMIGKTKMYPTPSPVEVMIGKTKMYPTPSPVEVMIGKSEMWLTPKPVEIGKGELKPMFPVEEKADMNNPKLVRGLIRDRYNDNPYEFAYDMREDKQFTWEEIKQLLTNVQYKSEDIDSVMRGVPKDNELTDTEYLNKIMPYRYQLAEVSPFMELSPQLQKVKEYVDTHPDDPRVKYGLTTYKAAVPIAPSVSEHPLLQNISERFQYSSPIELQTALGETFKNIRQWKKDMQGIRNIPGETLIDAVTFYNNPLQGIVKAWDIVSNKEVPISSDTEWADKSLQNIMETWWPQKGAKEITDSINQQYKDIFPEGEKGSVQAYLSKQMIADPLARNVWTLNTAWQFFKALGFGVPITVLKASQQDLSGDQISAVETITANLGGMVIYPQMQAGETLGDILKGDYNKATGTIGGVILAGAVNPITVGKGMVRIGQKVIGFPKTMSPYTGINTVDIPMSPIPKTKGLGMTMGALQTLMTDLVNNEYPKDTVIYDSNGRLIARVTPLGRAKVPYQYNVMNRFNEVADAAKKYNKDGIPIDITEIGGRDSPWVGQGSYSSPNISIKTAAAIEPSSTIGGGEGKTGVVGMKFKYKQPPPVVQEIYNKLSTLDSARTPYDVVEKILNDAVDKYTELERGNNLEKGTYPVFKSWPAPNVDAMLEVLKGSKVTNAGELRNALKGGLLEMNTIWNTYREILKNTPPDKVPDMRNKLLQWWLELESYTTKGTKLYPTKPSWDTTIKELGKNSAGSYIRAPEKIVNDVGTIVYGEGDKVPIIWLSEVPNDIAPSFQQRMLAEWVYEPMSVIRRLLSKTPQMALGYGGVTVGDLTSLEFAKRKSVYDYFEKDRRATLMMQDPSNPNRILVGRQFSVENNRVQDYFDTIGGKPHKAGESSIDTVKREAVDEADVYAYGGSYVGSLKGRHMDTRVGGKYMENDRYFDIYNVDYKGIPKASAEVREVAWYDGKNLYDIAGNPIQGKVSDITPQLYKTWENNLSKGIEFKNIEPPRAVNMEKPISYKKEVIGKDKTGNNIVRYTTMEKPEEILVLLQDNNGNAVYGGEVIKISRSNGQTIPNAIESELIKRGLSPNQYSYAQTWEEFPRGEYSEYAPPIVTDLYVVKVNNVSGLQYISDSDVSNIYGKYSDAYLKLRDVLFYKEYNPSDLVGKPVYLSLSLPEVTKKSIIAIQDRLKKEVEKEGWNFVEFPDTSRLHITMKYVKNPTARQVATLEQLANDLSIYLKANPLEINLGEWVTWGKGSPNIKDVEVVSLVLKSVKDMESIAPLKNKIEALATNAGIPTSEVYFDPHVTIATIKEGTPITQRLKVGRFVAQNKLNSRIPLKVVDVKMSESVGKGVDEIPKLTTDVRETIKVGEEIVRKEKPREYKEAKPTRIEIGYIPKPEYPAEREYVVKQYPEYKLYEVVSGIAEVGYPTKEQVTAYPTPMYPEIVYPPAYVPPYAPLYAPTYVPPYAPVYGIPSKPTYPPIVPPTPPLPVPPPYPPPLYPKPTVPVIPPLEKVKRILKRGEKEGLIAWKQGWNYRIIFAPWGQKDVLNTRKPVEGVEYKEGIRSAYDSIVRRGGYVPPVITRDMGIFTVQVSTMKDQRKPELRFRRDIKDVYKGKKKKILAKSPVRVRLVRL